jgi:hypothetical protein
MRRSIRLGRDALVAGALALATFVAARRLLAARPLIEGVDLFYYLCVARDLADGVQTSAVRHFYFPGVYRFWQAVFAVAGRSLPAIQFAYVALLAANALATAAVVWRGAGRAEPAALAGLWYLALCVPLEAYAGVTEPLATLPVLMGMAAWAGEPLAGLWGLARAIALGVGLGIAVYAKQLGGLLALGALALPMMNLGAPPERRHQWGYMAAVPVIALLVLLVGIAAEGEGLAPLRLGLDALSSYPAKGTFGINLLWLMKHAPLLALFTLGTLALFALFALEPGWRPLLGERWAALAGFGLLAGLFALSQYTKRAYLHYALLAAPLLIASVTLTATALIRRLPARASGWPESALVAAVAVWLLVIQRTTLLEPNIFVEPSSWRTQPEIAADLWDLKRALRPGEDMLILPPRRNEIHFLLGTRSRSFSPGYSWAPGSGLVEEALRKPDLDAVLVIRKHLDQSDNEAWRGLSCGRAVAGLGSAGFAPVLTLRATTLFRRRDASGDGLKPE